MEIKYVYNKTEHVNGYLSESTIICHDGKCNKVSRPIVSFFCCMTFQLQNKEEYLIIIIINITSIALKSSGPRPRKRNKTINHIQEPGTYRGHHPLRGRRLFKVE